MSRRMEGREAVCETGGGPPISALTLKTSIGPIGGSSPADLGPKCQASPRSGVEDRAQANSETDDDTVRDQNVNRGRSETSRDKTESPGQRKRQCEQAVKTPARGRSSRRRRRAGHGSGRHEDAVTEQRLGPAARVRVRNRDDQRARLERSPPRSPAPRDVLQFRGDPCDMPLATGATVGADEQPAAEAIRQRRPRVSDDARSTQTRREQPASAEATARRQVRRELVGRSTCDSKPWGHPASARPRTLARKRETPRRSSPSRTTAIPLHVTRRNS